MNIHEAVELMIAKDMRTGGFAAGFFDPESSEWADNQAMKDAFNTHARIVAIETVGLILGIPAVEMWTQYRAQETQHTGGKTQ